tara:strand:- start:607 stop:1206 length:600 start_codon:yes stop_codon:yes gene_type:complete
MAEVKQPIISPDRGLKENLINGKLAALKESGVDIKTVNTSRNSFLERDAEYTKEALINFLTHPECNFTITEIKAPVVVEKFKIPDIPLTIFIDTLLGQFQPVLKALRKLANPLGLGSVIDELEGELEKAIRTVLQNPGFVPSINQSKDGDEQDGGLESTGYVYIGDDPNSQDDFNVEDEVGQRDFTSVRLIRDDIENII